MSGPYRCFHCGGHGQVDVGYTDDGDEIIETCPRCKGSGGLWLRTAGPGFPKSDDPYEPVPRGMNW